VEEFLIELNLVFRKAEMNVQFRRQTIKEYEWAETNGGLQPKKVSDPIFWKYATHKYNSNRDPQDLKQSSPSGQHQTHAVKAKLPVEHILPNGKAFYFYRSGVWEWTQDAFELCSYQFLVGGSWNHLPDEAASGYRIALNMNYGYHHSGFRIVSSY
jgi:formylglycine-generating enzyme required for sulfatase activity